MHRILISTLILSLLINFSGCNGDDPPKPPPPAPEGISAVNGFFYKGTMGGTTLDKPMAFLVQNSSGDPISGAWVHFRTMVGDGNLVGDSAMTNVSGNAICEYNFSGALGHAEILAYVRDIDSIVVSLRANTLILGADGQGQYVMMGDKYQDILDYYGAPDQIDIPDNFWVIVVNYENSKGMVAVFLDYNHDNVIVDTASVVQIVLNNYHVENNVKTSDSVGIGTLVTEFISIYGQANSVSYFPGDANNPASMEYDYTNLGFVLRATPEPLEADRIVREINLLPPTK